MPRRFGPTLLTISLLGVMSVVLLTPIITVVAQGFELDGKFSTYWMRQVLSNDLYRQGLIYSVFKAILTTSLCLLISVPLAMLSQHFDFWGKRGWLSLIQIPLIMPPFVGAIGMSKMLARHGPINDALMNMGLLSERVDWMAISFDLNPLLQQLGLLAGDQTIAWLELPSGFLACAVLEALYLYPITFLNIQAALANIDPALDEAGRNLGAGAWRRFWRITLPLMRPGIFAGATIVFIWSFTELGTPLMVGLRRVTAVQVYDKLLSINKNYEVYALVVVLLLSSVAMYAIGKWVLGRSGSGMMAKATVAAEPRRVGWRGSILVVAPYALVFFVAVLPHISVILMSISKTGSLVFSPENMTGEYHAMLFEALWSGDTKSPAHSVINSFRYAVMATGVDIVLGFLIAYLVVRRRSVLTGLLDSLAMLPLAVPGLVMAFGYLAMSQPDSLIARLVDTPLRGLGLLGPDGTLVGQLNPVEHDPTMLLVIAYATRRLPFLVRSCAAGLEQTSEALEEASINLGAGPVRTMAFVVVPLLAANLIAGALLVFSRSMLEVSDSLILAFDREDYPMTKEIVTISENPQMGTELASALGVWCMVLLTVAIVGASLAIGKRLGALFRV